MATGVKLALSAVAAAIAVTATVWLWRGDAGASAAAPRIDAGSVAAVAADVGAERTLPVAPQLDRREVVDAPSTNATADLVTVRGRCVDAPDNSPLAGASVRLWIHPAQPAKEHELVPRRVTGDDGRFEFRFAPGPGRVQVELRAERRMRRTAGLGELLAGKVVELGDIPMLAGARVHGRTLDASGRPISKCSVALRALPFDVRNPSTGLTFARSDEEGGFTFDEVVPPGTWGLEVSRRDLAQVDPTSITVRDADTDVEVIVHLAALPSITGSICDENGLPIAGATIRPLLANRHRPADSGPDGSFELFALEPSQPPQPLEATAAGYENAQLTEPVAWGSRDVRFVLRRGVSITIEVVERLTHVPVREYAVAVNFNQSMTLPMAETATGRRTLQGVQRGRHGIAILPKDEMLLVSSTAIDVQDSTPCVHFEVERLQPRSVEVRDAAGKPLAGAMVEVLHLADSPLLDSRPFDYRQRWPSFDTQFTSQTNPLGARYLTATTDADGVAKVGVPDNDPKLGVRASHAGASPRLLRQPPWPPGQPLTITLDTSPTLRGTLRVAGYPAGLAALALDMGPGMPMREIAVDMDGTFAVGDLAAGQYALHFAVDHVALSPALQQVTLRSGETTSVEVDASRFDACSLNGRIVLDGRGMPGIKVELLLLVSGRERRTRVLGPFVADADGRFEAHGLPPGEGTLQLPVDRNGMERRLRFEEPILLKAGATLQRQFDFVRRRLLVHAHDDQGAAVTDRRIEATWADGSFCTSTTDADGNAEFDWMSAGKVVLSGKRDPLRIMRGQPPQGIEVELSPTARETKVDLLLR